MQGRLGSSILVDFLLGKLKGFLITKVRHEEINKKRVVQAFDRGYPTVVRFRYRNPENPQSGIGPEILSVLAGPTCDSFDVMYDGLLIPEQQIGDKLVFPLTGAYCAVSGSDFNSLARPEYKVID